MKARLGVLILVGLLGYGGLIFGRAKLDEVLPRPEGVVVDYNNCLTGYARELGQYGYNGWGDLTVVFLVVSFCEVHT